MQQSEIIMKYLTDKYNSEPEKISLKWKTLTLMLQGSVKEDLKYINTTLMDFNVSCIVA